MVAVEAVRTPAVRDEMVAVEAVRTPAVRDEMVAVEAVRTPAVRDEMVAVEAVRTPAVRDEMVAVEAVRTPAVRDEMVAVEAVRTPAVRDEMVAVEAVITFAIVELTARVVVERVLTVRAVGWLVAVVYHLPALPVREREPKAVVMVLLVVPSSKVSEPLVAIVIVLTAAAPVVSFSVSVRPGIVVVRGNVIVPGRIAELRKTRLVVVDNDMSLYCCLGSFW